MKPFPTTQAHFSRTHLEDDRALWSTSTQPLEFLFVADKAVKDTLPLLTALPDIQHAAAKENRRPSHFLFWSYHAKPIWFSAGSCCVRSVWPWEAAVEWGQMASYHWGKATGKCTSALPTPGTCCMETGCRWVYRTEGCPQAVKDDLQQETAPLRKEMFQNALRQDASSCNICQRFLVSYPHWNKEGADTLRCLLWFSSRRTVKHPLHSHNPQIYQSSWDHQQPGFLCC